MINLCADLFLIKNEYLGGYRTFPKWFFHSLLYVASIIASLTEVTLKCKRSNGVTYLEFKSQPVNIPGSY